MQNAATPRDVDTAMIRRLAVEADADPRTVRRVLRGERVRGMVDRRVRRVLAAHDLLADGSHVAAG